MSRFHSKGRELLILSILTQACNSLFYHPDSVIYSTPDQVGQNYESFTLPVDDQVSLHAWHVSAKKPRMGTVLHFHGNAQNMTSHFLYVYWLAEYGFDIITFDYRGYGTSTGKPTREGIYRDSLAILQEAVKRSEHLFILGQSLGGAVAIPAIAKLKPANLRGLILDSSFSSYQSIVEEKLSASLITYPIKKLLKHLVGDEYSPRDFAEQISVPTLIIHGKNDPVVPYIESKRLSEFIPHAEFWTWEGEGHTQAFASENSYRQQLVNWMLRQVSSH